MRVFIGAAFFSLFCCSVSADYFDFDKWNDMMINLKIEARNQGISEKIISNLVDNSAFIPSVIHRDKNQPEFKQSFQDYKSRLITDDKIKIGKKMKARYSGLLARAEAKYGVPRHYILAFWALESNYGEYRSKYNLSNSFLTLIYDGRRESFFKKQLFALMKSAEKSGVDLTSVKGSWAGAMGHFQFIPTTMEMYAVDGNGDGKIDIINNVPDAIFSAANYLSRLGWDKNYRVLREVYLPVEFDMSLVSDTSIRKYTDEWHNLGVRTIDGAALPDLDYPVAIIVPDDDKNNAFLVYDNFYRIKKWNNSTNYALVIGLLAEQLK